MHHSDNDNAVAIASNDINFFSVCSGIEAASVAWTPLGWTCAGVSEIEKFPSAVLTYRYPDVPNHGDFTKIDVTTLPRIAILCGGTPCQAFSVAGLRNSLDDARGNLSLEFVRLAHELADGNGLRNVVWENVPGVLNTKDNAFGCFLGGLVGADDAIPPPHGSKWPDAGMVAGPRGRAAWRILDAQFFGLAQRRRRVIVVADFGNGADPAAVLFERVGMQGNSAPSREKREGIAVSPALRARANSSHRLDSQAYVPEIAGTMKACAGKSGGFSNSIDHAAAGYMVPVGYAPEIARCDATREGSSQDYETTTMVAHAIQGNMVGRHDGAGPLGARHQEELSYTLTKTDVHAVCITGDIAHTLKAEGADASEDGTGRGTPIIAFDPRQSDVLVSGEITQPLDCGFPGPAICFTAKDYGADAAEDIAPTLRAGTHDKSHANGGVSPAIAYAFQPRIARNGRGDMGDVVSALNAQSGETGKGDAAPCVAVASAVRRLTPTECERLQGFPDGYTDIPWRGKPNSPDGPRYKALGNSWAVPKFRWLGERIQRFMPPLVDVANDNTPALKAA